MSDELKSAWELALEKLQENGSVRKLTEQQKQQISEIRKKYQARIAEREISLQSQMRKAAQEGALEQVESVQKQLVEERQVLQAEMEEKVEEIRQAEG